MVISSSFLPERAARLLLVTASLLFSYSAHAEQPSKQDSIDSHLAAISDEDELAVALLEAAKFTYAVDKERSVSYTERLLVLATVKADSSLYMEALRRQAAANRWLGNYVRSIEEFKACYDYYRHHRDTTHWAFSANHLGAMHVFMGYTESAQNYMNEVYNLEKARGNPSAIAGATNGLAIFYSNINQNEKARERYEEALTLFESVDDTLGRANVHANLGLLLIDMEDYELAEYHLRMQGKLDTLINSQWGLGFYFDFMGYLRRMQGRLEEAYESHATALSIREHLESHYNVSESRANLCDILLDLKRYPEAIRQAELILETKDLHNSLSHQQKAYSTLSQGLESMGDYKGSLAYQKSYKMISDSILNLDILDKVAEKDAKFDLAEQRNRVALLNAQNSSSEAVIALQNRTIRLGTAALLLFFGLSLGLYILSRKYLRKKRVLATTLSDKELLLKEIHHRVKNNLQIVSSLLSLQSRTVSDAGVLQAINEGKSRVRSMALIHQNLYQSDNLTGVAVKPYLEKLSSELFSTYSIDTDTVQLNLDIASISLDVDTLVPLGLIINELITNSLKHAFAENDVDSSADAPVQSIRVVLHEKGKELVLEVSDTGKGFDPESQSKSEGFGQKLLRSLSAQLGAKPEVVTGPGGTRTILRIAKFKKVA